MASKLDPQNHRAEEESLSIISEAQAAFNQHSGTDGEMLFPAGCSLQ